MMYDSLKGNYEMISGNLKLEGSVFRVNEDMILKNSSISFDGVSTLEIIGCLDLEDVRLNFSLSEDQVENLKNENSIAVILNSHQNSYCGSF